MGGMGKFDPSRGLHNALTESGSDPLRGKLVQPAGSHIIMGASSWPGTYSGGMVDDLRIYNRALTEKEVAALYEFEKVKS